MRLWIITIDQSKFAIPYFTPNCILALQTRSYHTTARLQKVSIIPIDISIIMHDWNSATYDITTVLPVSTKLLLWVIWYNNITSD